MINPPPDPASALDAELRSEDDGMPEHPQKAADPVSWAEEHVAREKASALGYPASRIGQAWTDVVHGVHRLIHRTRTPRERNALIANGVGLGVGVAVYFLFIRKDRRPHRRRRFAV